MTKRPRHKTRRQRLTRKAILIGCVVFGVAWVAFLASLKAEGYCAQWGVREVCRAGVSEGDAFSVITGRTCVRHRYCRHWVRTDYRERDPHWRDVERRHWRTPGRAADLHYRSRFPVCKERMIRATGDDKLTEKDAKVSAQDRWSQTVEARFGTIYSDIDNAGDMDISCVKKVPTSTIEKGQAALGVRHFVCEVEALPCQPDRIPQDAETRAKRRFEQ